MKKSGGTRDIWLYGMGNLGVSAMSQAVVTFFMFFGTAVLGFSGRSMGALFSVSVLWDAVTDPLSGMISDRYPGGRLGRRKPFLLLATVPAVACFLLMWCFPYERVGGGFLYLALFMLLFQTATTFFYTPYAAMGLELCRGLKQTKLQSIRSLFSMLGSAMPMLVIGLLQLIQGREDVRYLPKTYALLGLILGALSLLSLAVLFALREGGAVPEAGEKATSWRAVFGDFFRELRNWEFRSVLIGYTLILTASSIITGMGMHIFTYVFELGTGQMFLLLAELFGFIVLSQPFWVNLSKKYEKRKLLRIGLYVTVAGCLMILLSYFLAENLQLPLLLTLTPALVTTGVGIGSTYPIPYAIVAESISQRNTASVLGCMTFVFKLAQAVAVLLSGWMLDFSGFASANTGAWTDSGRQKLLVLFGATLVILLLLAAKALAAKAGNAGQAAAKPDRMRKPSKRRRNTKGPLGLPKRKKNAEGIGNT